MDIGKLDMERACSAGAWLHLAHPATGRPLMSDIGEEQPMRIRLLGRDSKIVRRVQRTISNERLARAAEGQTTLTAEQLADENHRIVLAATVGWEGFERGTEVLEFSEKEADSFYAKNEWASDQALAFLTTRANFSMP